MAGQFNFSMPASDPKADLITEKRRVRAYAMRNGVWTEEGDGIIDSIDITVADGGTVELAISGNDGSSELDGFIVPSTISLSNGSTPQLPTYALGLLQTYSTLAASAVWTFDATDTGSNTLYGAFYDESVLRAIIVIAQKAGCHWRYEGSRTIKFFTSFTSSGLRAIEQNGNLSAETCAITSIKKTIDTHELAVGVFARGAGQGLARFGFNATTRSAPTGYYAVPNISYLVNLDALALYGTIDRPVDFKDIGPISNTDADLTAAANALFDSAALYLRRYSQRVTTYTLAVEGCSARLKPGQTIRVDYHDPVAGIDINEDLYIIETTTSIGDDGVNTTGLVVSTLDAWPIDDVSVLVDRLAEGKVYQANPQLNANSYTTGYTKNLDDTVTASFRFRFGSEVTQLQQVLFEFQLLPFESTVKSVGGTSTSTSGGGAATVSAAAGGGATSSSTGSHTHSVSISAHTHTATTSNHTHSVTISAHTHTAATSNHSHTVSISSHTHDVSISSHTHTVPNHVHNISLASDSSGTATPANITALGGNYFISTATLGTQVLQTTSNSGSVTSNSGGSSTPSSNAGGSSTPSSSSGGGETVTSSSGGSATPSSSSGGGETVTSGNGASSTSTSDAGGTHDHTVSAHTHGVTIADHTHSVTAAISAVYGIFREVVGNTYTLADLEYRVNSNSWVALSTSTSLGGGWYRLDVTSLVYDSVSFRPLAESNVVEVRKAAAAAASKTVTIDALLSVRNIIQAISYV